MLACGTTLYGALNDMLCTWYNCLAVVLQGVDIDMYSRVSGMFDAVHNCECPLSTGASRPGFQEP